MGFSGWVTVLKGEIIPQVQKLTKKVENSQVFPKAFCEGKRRQQICFFNSTKRLVERVLEVILFRKNDVMGVKNLNLMRKWFEI